MADLPPTHTAIESALSSLQPIRDLSRNWDVDIASWYVLTPWTGLLPIHTGTVHATFLCVCAHLLLSV
jgi:hypothetical protein